VYGRYVSERAVGQNSGRFASGGLAKTLRSRKRQSGSGLPSSTPVRRCTRHPATFPFRPMAELKRCRPWPASGTEYLPVARSEPSPSGVMIGSVGASTVPLAYPSWAYWGRWKARVVQLDQRDRQSPKQECCGCRAGQQKCPHRMGVAGPQQGFST
jgi:hypothetical protein